MLLSIKNHGNLLYLSQYSHRICQPPYYVPLDGSSVLLARDHSLKSGTLSLKCAKEP